MSALLCLKLKWLTTTLAPMGDRVLAIDWGEVRLGLAMSDETQTIAQGLDVYERRSLDEDIAYLSVLIHQHDVERVIVGVPVHMDGAHSEQTGQAEAFRRELETKLPVPIESIDERMTTAEAERSLLEADLSRRKRKAKRDQLAATLILQRYLDRQRRLSSG